MKFATYQYDGSTHVGVVVVDDVDGDVVFVCEADTMLDVVRGGLPAALKLGATALSGTPIPLADVTLHAPLQPPTMRDFVAFEEHVEGVRRSIDGQDGVVDAWYEAPRFYFTNPHAVIGSGVTVNPPVCNSLDFELEVAAVVGKSASSATVDEAHDLIFGYTILNDWSARDLQRREMQVNLGPAKGKDFANTLGPWIVTADEMEHYRDADGFMRIDAEVSVNGQRVGNDSFANMGWTFESLVAYASRDTWVHPGDVLGSGTVGHGGCLAELWGRRGKQSPPPLQEGDVVTMTVQGIGSITNVVGRSQPRPEVPPARRIDHAETREGIKI